MPFLKLTKVCLAVSAVLVAISIALLVYPGPRLSIEFTGGTLMELRLPETKGKAELENSVKGFVTKDKKSFENVSIAAVRDSTGSSYELRLPSIDNEEHQALLAHIKKDLGTAEELRFNTIGPSVSASLRNNSLLALFFASVALILYLAFSFRGMPKPLSPWKFGVLAVVAFIHDVIITAGIFVIISRYTSFEVDTLFVTALLTILAYSANDTIVIFDRIRSSVQADPKADLAVTVVRGLRECLTRTIHTTVSSLIMLTSLFVLGSESIRWFMLALIVGTLIGTYSSYFIASPLLIYWTTDQKRRR